jgi:hypothetical protein
MSRKGTSPSYAENKVHIYKWIDKNRDKHNGHRVRSYYKNKIQCPIWKQIKYIYLDILIEDYTQ